MDQLKLSSNLQWNSSSSNRLNVPNLQIKLISFHKFDCANSLLTLHCKRMCLLKQKVTGYPWTSPYNINKTNLLHLLAYMSFLTVAYCYLSNILVFTSFLNFLSISSRLSYSSNQSQNYQLVSRQDFQKQPPRVFCKKVFLEISQNSQENTCARVSFLIKLQVSAKIKITSWSVVRISRSSHRGCSVKRSS